MDNAVAVSVEDVVKVYKSSHQPALNGLSLRIDKGEIFGLLGPNGAGKTTTLSLISGMSELTSGSIKVFDTDVSFKMKGFLNKMGMVPQEIALFPSLSGLENLQYFASMYGLKKEESTDLINEYLEKFGLTNAKKNRLHTYSGGMKRRINLLAGILHKPSLLVLDEPTVGIDVQSKAVIIDFLLELNRNGTTILYTSHHLDEAQDFCSRISIIDEGTSIALGSPKDLIKEHHAEDLQDVFLKITGKRLRD